MATQGLLVPYLEVRVLLGLLFFLFFDLKVWKKIMFCLKSTNPILIIAGGIAAIAITVACAC